MVSCYTLPGTLFKSMMDAFSSSGLQAASPPPPPPNPGEGGSEGSDAAADKERLRQKKKKKEEEQALMEELWPRETKDQLCYSVQVDEAGAVVELPITQDLMARRFEDAIGNIVWDAAVGMHHYFTNRDYFPQGYFRGKKVLELGTGTGLVGLTLAALGAKVYLTDLPNALDILHHNIKACFPPQVMDKHGLTRPVVEALSWGEPVPDGSKRVYDMVVGSDITYDVEKCGLLLETLHEVCVAGSTVLYLGHLERGNEDVFFTNLSAKEGGGGFDVVEVYREDTKEDGVARAHWVHVYKGVKRRGEGAGRGR